MPHASRLILAAALAGLLSFSVAPSAVAQEEEGTEQGHAAAKALAEQAMQAHAEGRYGDAAELFDSAYAAWSDAILLWNAARAHHKADNLLIARDRYETCLSLDAFPAKYRTKAAKYLVEVEVALRDREREAAGEPAAPAPTPAPPPTAPLPADPPPSTTPEPPGPEPVAPPPGPAVDEPDFEPDFEPVPMDPAAVPPPIPMGDPGGEAGSDVPEAEPARPKRRPKRKVRERVPQNRVRLKIKADLAFGGKARFDGGGFLTVSSLSLDDTYGGAIQLEAPIGFEYISVGGFSSITGWKPKTGPNWQVDRSIVFDIGLLIGGRYAFMAGPLEFEVVLLLPVGLSFDFVDKKMATFDANVGVGWNLSLMTGLTVLFTPGFGIFVEMGWRHHQWSHETKDPNPLPFELVKDQFGLGLGIVFGM